MDVNRLELIVAGVLERLQCHFEAAQAASDQLESTIENVRAALKADALERALEAALERVLPAALQRAVQALPVEGVAAPVKRHVPPGGSAISLTGRRTALLQVPTERRRKVCGDESDDSGEQGPALRRTKSHNVRGRQAAPLQACGGSFSGHSLQHKSAQGVCVDLETASEAPRPRKCAGSSDSIMEACVEERHSSSSEEEEVANAKDASPASSEGHLALGQWGGRASGSSSSNVFSRLGSVLSAEWMARRSMGMQSADLEQMTFVSRLQRQDQVPSRVRPSFRTQRTFEAADSENGQGAPGVEEQPGGKNSESSAKRGRSLISMGRTRSQSKRNQQRMSTRKARWILAGCTFLVLVNAIWVGLRSHYVMRSELIRHGVEVHWEWAGLPRSQMADHVSAADNMNPAIAAVTDGEGWGHPLLDGVFTLLFMAELCIRFWLARWEFFCGEHWRWNVFDVVLVLVTVVHWFINVLLIDALHLDLNRLPRVTFLRILRLPRVAIDFSHLDCIHSLQLMTASILHSLTFSWVAFSVVIAIIYLFSVCFVQGIIDTLENAAVGSIKNEDLANIAQKFGSVQITILSLFQAISGGVDWVELMGPLSFAPWRYTLLLFIYIFVVVFGVLNIVTSMFVECVCQVTKEDYKERIRTELLAQARWMDQLRNIFYEADEDQSGGLSWNEFSSLVNVPMMRAYFTTLELNIEEAKEIFEYLDVEGQGEVNMQEVPVVVDDRIPMGQGGLPRFTGFSKDDEIWPCIFEKAVAKLAGGYHNIDGADPLFALGMLTGTPSTDLREYMSQDGNWTSVRPNFKSSNPHDQAQYDYLDWPDGNAGNQGKHWSSVLKLMAEYDKKDYLMCAGTHAGSDKDTNNFGIVQGHAYTVIAVELNVAGSGRDMLQLRNPWGTGEWKGDWSDESDLWQRYPNIKKALAFEFSDDGIFWIEAKDFFENYATVEVCCKTMPKARAKTERKDRSAAMEEEAKAAKAAKAARSAPTPAPPGAKKEEKEERKKPPPPRRPIKKTKQAQRSVAEKKMAVEIPAPETLTVSDGTSVTVSRPPSVSLEEWEVMKASLQGKPEEAKRMESFCKDGSSIRSWLAAKTLSDYYESKLYVKDEEVKDSIRSLQNSAEFGFIYKEMKEYGKEAAIQKYLNNNTLMARLGKAMGGVPSDVVGPIAHLNEKPVTLHEACKMGDIHAVKDYVAAAEKAGGADLDVKDAKGIAPLAYAIGANRIAIVKLLLEKKADVKAVDSKGGTGLHYAAAYGRKELAEFLAGAGGGNVNAKTEQGLTPLALATKNKQKDVIDMLKKLKATM